jgi:iron complex outermembrane recepter protein
VAHREPRMKDLYDGEEAGAGFEPRFERSIDGSYDYARPLVRPERLWNVELGSRHVTRMSRVAANVFLMLFEDEIVPSGGLDQFGVPRTGNAERTRHVGVEIEGEVALYEGLGVLGNLTLSRNRFLRFTEYDGTGQAVSRNGNPIAGFPEQTGYLGALFQRGVVTLNAGSRIAGRQFIDNSGDRDSSVDPYALLDVSIAVEPAGGLSGLRARLDVNNVLNSRVLMYGNVGPLGPQYFPAATRHLFAGLSYTF